MDSHVISLIRTFSGLDQAEFAEAIGTDQPMVSRFESGEREIPDHYIPRIKTLAKSAVADADEEKATVKAAIRAL